MICLHDVCIFVFAQFSKWLTVRVWIHRKFYERNKFSDFLAWAEGDIDVGDRAPPTPQKSEDKFRVIWLSMRKNSHCIGSKFWGPV